MCIVKSGQVVFVLVKMTYQMVCTDNALPVGWTLKPKIEKQTYRQHVHYYTCNLGQGQSPHPPFLQATYIWRYSIHYLRPIIEISQ